MNNGKLKVFVRFATFACLCVFSAQIRAAENAYVSVTVSSGSVVCDGLDFYIVPDTIAVVVNGETAWGEIQYSATVSAVFQHESESCSGAIPVRGEIKVKIDF